PYGVPGWYAPQFLPAGINLEQARKVNQDPELYICGKLPMTARDFQILNALYDSDVRYLDEEIGMLLSSFRSHGLLDNTLVIFISDHGEHFGDHGLMSHELSIYDSLIRIPMILRHPGTIPAGTRIAAVAQTVDLFPSILRFLGVPAGKLDLQGASLLPRSSDRDARPFAFAEYNNARAIDKIQRRFPGFSSPVCRARTLKAVRSADLKLIVGDDGTREFYNMKADPDELHNLYAEAPDEARILEDVLKKWSASFEASRYFKQENISKEALEELKALGYVQ
ncbi:MAG TPA: sulfatase-like hydrolase/transferase, partial [Acidobacteriota bacterium]|nr:sulfatase-like hydrolase/transferase [Acidobacteriota bacterium]